MNILPVQLTKRFHLLMMSLVIIPFILLGVFTQLNYIKDRTSEREKELLLVAKHLNETLPSSLNEIIEDSNALNKGSKEKVLALNKILQPIIDKLSKTHPNLGIGYYSIELDSVIAIGPTFKPELLTKTPRSYPYFESYKTGKPEVVKSGSSIGWNGEPILAVTYPIVEDGKIVGHTWANIKMDDIYADVWERLQKFIFTLLLVIASIVLVSRYIFNNFKRELEQVANTIANSECAEVTMERVPEIESLLQLISKRTNQLRDNETRFRTIFEGADIGIALDDIDGNIIECNQALANMLGYSIKEMFNMNFAKFTHSEDLSQEMILFNELVEGKIKQYQMEKRYICKDGKVIWVNVKISTDKEHKFIIGLVEDITEIKKYKQEMSRLDSLNIVGQMAAGISHEVRNPMTTVRGFLQMLSNKKEYEKDKEFFNLMISELDRANSIITEFLSIGKNKPSQLRLQSINEIIETLDPLIQADALGANKYVELQLGDIPELPLSGKEIRQVILNLVRNGLEAMESSGKITISTKLEESKVILEVKDEGSGIPAEVLDKMGTPFFTTKEKGTGLGLATCYSIIDRHNGKISVKTSASGTTFTISFPVD